MFDRFIRSFDPNVFETENISLKSINLQNWMNLKFSETFSKNLSKTGKITEVFFVRLRFHLMRQSELKVRANKQF